MSVVDQITRGPGVAESLHHGSEVCWAIANHHQRRRLPNPFETLDRFLLTTGWVEDTWMGNDPEKLVSAGPRYGPGIGLFR